MPVAAILDFWGWKSLGEQIFSVEMETATWYRRAFALLRSAVIERHG
jgi:hypothetical protein